MLKFDITLIIQIVEALIMTFILYYILIKPVMSYMKELSLIHISEPTRPY